MSLGSTSRHCYAVGCHNGDYKILRWQKSVCEVHKVEHYRDSCDCTKPFELYSFPTKRSSKEKRETWISQFSRADPKHPHKLLEPSKDHRVCSEHFIDGEPTTAHPYPELKLGHCKKREASENISDRDERYMKRMKTGVTSESSASEIHVPQSVLTNKPQWNWSAIQFIIYILFSVIRTLKKQKQQLHIQNIQLKSQVSLLQKKLQERKQMNTKKSVPIHTTILKNDSDVQYYTGLDNMPLFKKIHDFVTPFVRRRWRGIKCISTKVRKFSKSPQKFGPERKLPSIDEFLLTLIWLRLGLLRKDLADRFQISVPLCGQIFNSWITAMSKVLSQLVFWPSKEQVIASKPKRFKHLPDLRAIIDCSEVFIETPKDPNLQAATWSDYKHHNTGKFLVAVAPNSSIIFVSNVYNGRASDKSITNSSGFLDLLEPYDMLQADKGFMIQDECSARLVQLQIPPGKRGQAQMSKAANIKTSRIANLRILVEQVIRRIKTFRIIKYTVPISLLPALDKILKVCCALSNLKKPIYRN